MENVDILSIELDVPFMYLAVYIGLVTVVALLSRYKFLLIVSSVFVLYVVYFHNYSLIGETLKGSPAYVGLYFVSGVIILILAIISLFREQ